MNKYFSNEREKKKALNSTLKQDLGSLWDSFSAQKDIEVALKSEIAKKIKHKRKEGSLNRVHNRS